MAHSGILTCSSTHLAEHMGNLHCEHISLGTSRKKRKEKVTTTLSYAYIYSGILLPKLFWPTVRKNCSSDWEKILKFEAEGREFAKFLRSLEQFIQTVKGQNNSW